MAKTKKLCFMAVLTAIALTIFMIENQLPSPVPIPGIKLGLANIITLTAMAILGRKEAGAILAARIIMGAIFAGSPSTFIYSAAGGILAYIVMCVTIGLFKENQLWIVSALAAIAHNAGQLGACALIVKTPGHFCLRADTCGIRSYNGCVHRLCGDISHPRGEKIEAVI